MMPITKDNPNSTAPQRREGERTRDAYAERRRGGPFTLMVLGRQKETRKGSRWLPFMHPGVFALNSHWLSPWMYWETAAISWSVMRLETPRIMLLGSLARAASRKCFRL